MVLNHYDTKPSVIQIGAKRRGKYAIFVTFGICAIEEAEDPNYKYKGYGCKIELSNIDAKDALSNLTKEHVLLASKEELLDFMIAFNAADDVDAWAAIKELQVSAYDSSDNVNMFQINGRKCWYDKDTRVGLSNMYRLCSLSNDDAPPLWVGSDKIEISSNDIALDVLAKIEKYALQCYSATQQHLSEIKSAQESSDIETLKNYDITADYPAHVIIQV